MIDDRFTCSISGLVTWKRDSTLCTISTNYFTDESVCMGDSGKFRTDLNQKLIEAQDNVFF